MNPTGRAIETGNQFPSRQNLYDSFCFAVRESVCGFAGATLLLLLLLPAVFISPVLRAKMGQLEGEFCCCHRKAERSHAGWSVVSAGCHTRASTLVVTGSIRGRCRVCMHVAFRSLAHPVPSVKPQSASMSVKREREKERGKAGLIAGWRLLRTIQLSSQHEWWWLSN